MRRGYSLIAPCTVTLAFFKFCRASCILCIYSKKRVYCLIKQRIALQAIDERCHSALVAGLQAR